MIWRGLFRVCFVSYYLGGVKPCKHILFYSIFTVMVFLFPFMLFVCNVIFYYTLVSRRQLCNCKVWKYAGQVRQDVKIDKFAKSCKM